MQRFRSALNCFELVKEVLDEQYALLGGATADTTVEGTLKHLHDEYEDLTTQPNLDYSSPEVRFAYIYRYVTAHALVLYNIVRQSAQLQALFDQEQLRVSCIGGGPGSDLIGILKYLDQHGGNARVSCTIVDREPLWGTCWNSVYQHLGNRRGISATFMPCDICDATSWPQWLPSHASADLYTLVFFLSEVFSQQTIAEPYLNALLDAADEGTYLLYVDNRSWQFYRWMEKLLGGHAYQVIGGASCDMRLPVEEEKLALGDYLGKFGSPKLKSNVAWRVAVKG